MLKERASYAHATIMPVEFPLLATSPDGPTIQLADLPAGDNDSFEQQSPGEKGDRVSVIAANLLAAGRGVEEVAELMGVGKGVVIKAIGSSQVQALIQRLVVESVKDPVRAFLRKEAMGSALKLVALRESGKSEATQLRASEILLRLFYGNKPLNDGMDDDEEESAEAVERQIEAAKIKLGLQVK